MNAYFQKSSLNVNKKSKEHKENKRQDFGKEEFFDQLDLTRTSSENEELSLENEDPLIIDDEKKFLTERLEAFRQENMILMEEIQNLEQKYKELKESKQYPLTEDTGRKMISAINNLERISTKPSVSTNAHQEEKKDAKTDILDFGEDILIKKRVYDEICKHVGPSRFVISLAQNVWSIEDLAERCVRKQSNVNKVALEIEKKQIIKEKFESWLRKNRKYPEHLVVRELTKVHKYLNSAITGARKKADAHNYSDGSNSKSSKKQRLDDEAKDKDKTRANSPAQEDLEVQKTNASSEESPANNSGKNDSLIEEDKLDIDGSDYEQ